MNWRKLAEAVDGVRHHVRLRRWDRERAQGRRAEDLAHRYLQAQGITIVSRNYRSRTGHGEIDLIGWEGDALVFFEVKSRANELFRGAEANVGEEKQRNVMRTAAEFMRRARVPLDRARFDVVSVVFENKPVIRHVRGMFGHG